MRSSSLPRLSSSVKRKELITSESLNAEAAKRYIITSLKREFASENGTELNTVLPKMSPLNPQFLTKKQTVFQKIAAFVEKFKGVGGSNLKSNLSSKINRCNLDPLMPKFSADYLPCSTILGELFVCQRRIGAPPAAGAFHPAAPRTASAHIDAVARACCLGPLPCIARVHMPLLDVGFVRGDQRAPNLPVGGPRPVAVRCFGVVIGTARSRPPLAHEPLMAMWPPRSA